MSRIPRSALVGLSFVAACMEEGPDTGRDETALASDKVTICHVPPGNPGNAHEITVGPSALTAHLAHGDQPGLCGPVCAIEGATCVADDDCCLGSCQADHRCRAVSIRGVAWYDASFDGLRDSGERLLAGVRFELYDAATGSLDVAVTDVDGSYAFYSVKQGEYFIEVDPGSELMLTPKANVDENIHDARDSDFDPDTRRSPTFAYTGVSISGIDCGLVPGT